MKFVHLTVGADQSRRHPRGRKTLVCAVIDALECRVMLSVGTLTPVATFNGTNGEAPVAVVEDSSGNLFGVTSYTQQGNGNVGSGVVFEIPAGTGAIQDLASLGGTSNVVEGTSLIIDSSGNLFGTTAGTNGILFEVAQGSTSLTTLASQTLGPVSVVDSSGNLFGTDPGGNVWELTRGSSAETDSVFPSAGALADLVIGPDGNFYGIGSSSLIEISSSTGMATTLASLDSSTIVNSPTGITVDSSGNIWGFSEYGGPAGPAPGNGTVWELPAGATAVSLVASFDSTTGTNPITRPVLGASGNLYGLTQEGGANGAGTYFGIAAGSTTITDLADLPTDVPSTTNAGIVADSAGVTPDTTVRPADSGVPLWTNDGGQYGPYVFDALFGDDSVSAAGGVDKLTTTPPPPPPPPATPPPVFPGLQGLKDALKMLQHKFDSMVGPPPPVPPPPPPPPNSVEPLSLHTAPTLKAADQRTATLMQIHAELSQASAQLHATEAQINKQTGVYKRYTVETNLVTRLNSQLASASSPSLKAQLQKRLTSAESAQTTGSSQDTADYNAITSELTSLSTLVATITSGFASIPPLTVVLSGTIVSVPSTVAAGGRATALVSVANTGTQAVAGTLEIGLAARPVGSAGMNDTVIGYIKVRTHIKAGASAAVHLSFKIPAALDAGDYLLVSQLDSGAAAENLIVSTPTFTVK